ncbi:Ig-like domain-containing protein [Konateibacter massiliensis]|uniref:Ig-like domain-containing protein n=1 Tax=Konateibacter massiliensis TaxID=2002841 RepID=UPI0015D4F755|nr:Ig-like domain-containing protein [Konateibacter massiliensis]
MNITNINQRQFDITMQREGVIVTDYYNTLKEYKVFFRRNNRGTTPQGKLRLYYSQDTDISIGTIFVLKGENYLITSQDSQESNIYYTSMAMKCSTTFTINYGGKYYTVPFVVSSDRYSVSETNTISIISGSVIIYTGLNDIVDSMSGEYRGFGGTYKVKNHFYNDNLAYIYMSREADKADTYSLTYNGITSLDINDGTYQLSYIAVKNGNVVNNPTLTFVSSDDTIATVDESGLLTMIANGNVTITATWTEGNISTNTNIIISGENIPTVSGTSSISGNVELRIGYSRIYTAIFKDENDNVVTGITPVWTITNNNFALSKFTITYPAANQVKIVAAEDDNLEGEKFTLNLVDADGLYKASTLEITIIYF